MEELIVNAKIENLPVVTEFIEGFIESHDGNMKSMMQISVATDEIFSNIAMYAYKDSDSDSPKDVFIQISVDADGIITLIFKDNGIAFNPLETKDPDITLSADERSIGGLGIFITKKTMDSVSYERVGDSNILTITKQI